MLYQSDIKLRRQRALTWTRVPSSAAAQCTQPCLLGPFFNNAEASLCIQMGAAVLFMLKGHRHNWGELIQKH